MKIPLFLEKPLSSSSLLPQNFSVLEDSRIHCESAGTPQSLGRRKADLNQSRTLLPTPDHPHFQPPVTASVIASHRLRVLEHRHMAGSTGGLLLLQTHGSTCSTFVSPSRITPETTKSSLRVPRNSYFLWGECRAFPFARHQRFFT
ncbi:uncharacterized protein LOC135170766 [Diachasmimorpha longicaudata]|uniref:uncharacterized protein LOC135170766 n=1 Tax=Diachasmimorpha longicaudata TaxID=58733 RepID=UPI0030B90711